MKKVLHIIVAILLIIGGLNWGLIGLFNFDVVAAIFGDFSIISRIVYVLVGLSALYALVMLIYKRGYCCSSVECKTSVKK